MSDKREARKRKIAMSAEERLAKITGLYKASEEKEKPKIQFASETVDPRVQEIETNHVKVEYSSTEDIAKEKSIEEIPVQVQEKEKTLKFSNVFSLRLFASFILGLIAVFQGADRLEFIGTIFTAFQVLGSIQELYSTQKYVYNEYLAMVGLGNDKIDLLIRIYDGICNDIYMFVFTYGMGLYFREVAFNGGNL